MSLSLELEGGGRAEIVESDGANAVVRSSRASPPGSTLTGTPDGGGRPFRVKVRSCRRADDGELPFVVEGRFVDVTKDQRALLPRKQP